MIRIGICDDEQFALDEIAELLVEVEDKLGEKFIISTYLNGNEVINNNAKMSYIKRHSLRNSK